MPRIYGRAEDGSVTLCSMDDSNLPDIPDASRAVEQRAVREVIDTDGEIRKSRGAARGAQILDYLFFLLYGLIVIEIVLELAGARETNGFKQVMDTITYPFLKPFKGLFADPAGGEYRVMFSYLAALGIYILTHLAVRATRAGLRLEASLLAAREDLLELVDGAPSLLARVAELLDRLADFADLVPGGRLRCRRRV